MVKTDEQEAVADFYDRDPQREWERQERWPMEFRITRMAIEEFGAPPPSDVLDVGGGPGRYALWLTQEGHRVTLFDLSQENLRNAQRAADRAALRLHASVHGSATDLSAFPAAAFDMVLLLGPLYHLKSRAERAQAVLEACRVLRPGGILLSAFLNRYALLRYVARYEPELIVQEPAFAARLLDTGDGSLARYAQSFSNISYWERVSAIEPFMQECGLEKVALLGAEGATAYIDDAIRESADEAVIDAWAHLNYRFAKMPELLSCSIHLIHIGRKP